MKEKKKKRNETTREKFLKYLSLSHENTLCSTLHPLEEKKLGETTENNSSIVYHELHRKIRTCGNWQSQEDKYEDSDDHQCSLTRLLRTLQQKRLQNTKISIRKGEREEKTYIWNSIVFLRTHYSKLRRIHQIVQ